MNWDQIEGKWKQLKGSVRAKWGEVTDSDFERVNGRREQLVGLIQERYGIARDVAEKQVTEWASSIEAVTEGDRTSPERPVRSHQESPEKTAPRKKAS